jgi:hypothetical protein
MSNARGPGCERSSFSAPRDDTARAGCGRSHGLSATFSNTAVAEPRRGAMLRPAPAGLRVFAADSLNVIQEGAAEGLNPEIYRGQ